MSDKEDLQDIIAVLPHILMDIMKTDQAPKVGVVIVLTENNERCTADFVSSTGPEDALRLAKQFIANLEEQMATETLQ